LSSPAHQSDRTLAEARTTLQRQREGGRRSIGRGSAELKRRHAMAKLKRIGVAVAAMIVGLAAAGIVIDGIGIGNLMLAVLAGLVIVAALASFPRLKVPQRSALPKGSLRGVVANTELWLERQRPALPAPAVTLVDQIGVQLDALGLQLERIDEREPAAVEVRKLVGEHLPELVSTYTTIPSHLRREPSGWRTPDEQLTESLGKISTEIDSVTRQLASGAIDTLAIRTRYLDYKYGDAAETAPEN
jgi:hypothetical protein